MQASLPDCTTMPRISSSAVTGRPGWMNMREPGARQARSETRTCCSGESFLSRSAANTRYAVISLVSEAGSKRSSAFSAASSWLLDRSPISQDFPMTEGGRGAAACAAVQASKRTRREKRCMGLPKKGPRIIRAMRRVLADNEQRLQVQFSFDALGDRARIVVRLVGSHVQAPQVADRQDLDGIGKP